jgi:hypothetical protein
MRMAWFANSSAKKPERSPKTGGRPAPEQSLTKRDEARVRKILEKCCKYGVPGLAISPDEMAVFPAQFESVTDEQLLLRVFASEETDLPFRPLSLAFLSYAAHVKAGLFIARVISCRWQGGFHHLALELPAQVATAETRKSFRVPVAPEADLVTEAITDAGRRLPGRCQNVSLAGALVAFDKESEAWLPVGSIFTLRMALPEAEVMIRAEVRRAAKEGLGLFFPQAVVDGELSPPDDHLAVVRGLERLWLQHKAAKAS